MSDKSYRLETIQEAKDYINTTLDNGNTIHCPCCNSFLQVYKRCITANSARALLILANEANNQHGNLFEPQHIQSLFTRLGLRATAMDYIQLARFGLIEKDLKITFPGDKKDSGYWKITQSGINFILGKLEIPEYLLVLKNKTIGQSLKKVNIQQCLHKKFNYQELIGFDLYKRSAEYEKTRISTEQTTTTGI